jgi:peptidoglycan/LPS O-acetylase OafA/YrhL
VRSAAHQAGATTPRDGALDLLRCLALALLIFAHVAQYVGSPLGGSFGVHGLYWESLGGVAVTLFLVLSGCVLELRYGHRRIDYLRFVGRRLWRIYPTYLLCLVFAVVVYLARLEMGSPPEYAFGIGLADVPLSVSGMYVYAGRWGGPFLWTSWFIGLIVAMYLLFPFLSRAVERRPALTLAALLVVSGVSRYVVGRGAGLPPDALEWLPLCRVFEFSAGVFAGMLLGTWASRRRVTLGPLTPFVSLMAAISFPMFLVHSSLLGLIPFAVRRGVSEIVAIAVFLAVSVAVSSAVLLLDGALRRSRLGSKIDAVLSTARHAKPHAEPARERLAS